VLLELSPDRLATAISIAASQTLGHQVGLGTDQKSFHAGKASVNGIEAALLARAGFGIPTDALSEQGLLRALSMHPSPGEILSGFGERWELFSNVFKPYPCAIVCHPSIDAARELATQVAVDEIVEILVQCSRLAIRLAGIPDPADGMKARLSITHGVAVALADGDVGLRQYSDERVRASDVCALRNRVTLVADDAIAADEAVVEIRSRDGTRLSKHVPHARGSKDRPLTEQELHLKVQSLVEPILPGKSQTIIDIVQDLDKEESTKRLMEASSR
jgi:2-methylcitrate dehydratase PrpD